jgi:hypothetical protein
MDETLRSGQPGGHTRRRRRRRRFLGRVGAAGASAPGPLERTRHAYAGEQLLRRAVLIDAVMTIIKYSNVDKPRGRRLLAEARAWVAADDPVWPFSFVNVCDALDLSVSHVRRSIDELSAPVGRRTAPSLEPPPWAIAPRYEAAG